jgi:FkbM family methyltransferase
VARPVLKRLERGFRKLRDKLIIRPIAGSRLVQRYTTFDFEAVIKDAGDHRIAFDPNDSVIGRRILQTGTWNRRDFQNVVKILEERRPVRAAPVFLDTGANIGTQTLYALLSGAFTRAVAVEPVPANLRFLRLNAWLNDLTDRIHIVAAAVGSGPGQLPLSLHPRNSGGHSLREAFAGAPTAMVEVRTVADILAELDLPPEAIGLWWLDIEGFEPEAIAGGESVIEASVPLCVEFNPHLYEAGVAANLLARLGRHYSTAFVLDRGRARSVNIAGLMAKMPTVQTDILFV